MKKSLTIFFFFLLSATGSLGQALTKEKLLELDLSWERALLNSEVSILENVLAEDFLWVHNHASLIDGKIHTVDRAKRIQAGEADSTKDRTSRDQQVVILGKTGVVSGFTVVNRPPGPVTYHFMRTYALVGDRIFLLSNHTMAIPDEEIK